MKCLSWPQPTRLNIVYSITTLVDFLDFVESKHFSEIKMFFFGQEGKL